jgi:hypothetical protein
MNDELAFEMRSPRTNAETVATTAVDKIQDFLSLQSDVPLAEAF